MEKKGQIIKKIVWFIVLCAMIIGTIIFYKKYNYNDFMKSVAEKNKTIFTRDSKVKCSEMDSYKVENIDYHDAMFSKTISVLPNLPYKVTCKVKVENVENEDENTTGGAHISIQGTTERSRCITGTEDWQELTLYFNSKNRNQVDIGFRLGGYEEKSKGTAWFSDFKIEEGTANSNSKWKMACFIFPEIDVNVDIKGRKEHVNLQMSQKDIQDIKNNLERFSTSIATMSRGKMSVECETITISKPIKTLSYDDENGYYVSANDVRDLIDEYVIKNEYDHIYVAFRMANKQSGSSTLVSDWIGLGGMDYLGIGFSNIRMPDDGYNYAYEYRSTMNTFPEEVFIHEFLHTLERNAKEYGYERPELHDYAKYSYEEDRLDGLKKWYMDYMNKEISYGGKKIGLPPEIFSYKPAHESNFKYGIELDDLDEPKNIIEVIRSLAKRVGSLFTNTQLKEYQLEDN